MIVVRVAGDERIVTRVRAELRSAAWNVIELKASAPQRPLASYAQNRDARAAVRANPRRNVVELWVATADASEEVFVVSAAGSADPGVLALRVSEALRARGLGVVEGRSADAPSKPAVHAEGSGKGPGEGSAGPSTPRAGSEPAANPATSAAAETGASTRASPEPGTDAAVSGEAEPAAASGSAVQPQPATPAASAVTAEASPKPVQPTAAEASTPEPEAAEAEDDADDEKAEDDTSSASSNAPASALLALSLAPALITSAGGLGPRLVGLADVRLAPLPLLSLSLFGWVPLWQRDLAGERGATRAQLFAIGGAIDLRQAFARYELSAGLGLASLLTVLRSTPLAAFEPRDTTLRTALLLARATLVWRFSDSVGLMLGGMLGWAIPQLELSPPPKRWGTPWLSAQLGLQISLY